MNSKAILVVLLVGCLVACASQGTPPDGPPTSSAFCPIVHVRVASQDPDALCAQQLVFRYMHEAGYRVYISRGGETQRNPDGEILVGVESGREQATRVTFNLAGFGRSATGEEMTTPLTSRAVTLDGAALRAEAIEPILADLLRSPEYATFAKGHNTECSSSAFPSGDAPDVQGFCHGLHSEH